MVLDLIEIGTFVIAFMAFLFILIAYSESNKPKTKKLLRGVLGFSIFILLNRIFTNLEFIGLPFLFNFLEHLSMVIASIFFLIFLLINGKIIGGKG